MQTSVHNFHVILVLATVVIAVHLLLLQDGFILPVVSALAVAGPHQNKNTSASSAPEFYSNIESPLAKIAAQYASSGAGAGGGGGGGGKGAVPAILSSEIESLNLPPQFNAHIGIGMNDDENVPLPPSVTIITATFAGGCFWGIQLAYDREPGVLATCVGYTQGNCEYPTYSAICTGETGHVEACLVAYDPSLVSYARLAELMFDRIPDPTMLNRVGKDRGTQYRTGLYAHSEEQLVEAQAAFEKEDRTWFGRQVVTEVKRAGPFWPAEEEHQRYLEKGGRFGRPQSAEKGLRDEIRCYG